MVIELFSICDAATSEAGKLNILGAFDMMWVKKLPSTYPQCTIAMRIRFFSHEIGKHHMRLNILDPESVPVIKPLKGDIDVVIPPGQSSGSVNLILNIQKLVIENLGVHSIEFTMGDEMYQSIPLFVKMHPVCA
jgi:hypothetical protein